LINYKRKKRRIFLKILTTDVTKLHGKNTDLLFRVDPCYLGGEKIRPHENIMVLSSLITINYIAGFK